jgi:hypothetical protein
VTQTEQPAALAEPADAGQWLREHAITVAAATMIIAALWWKAVLLGHAYLRQDDFSFLDHGMFSGLGWSYLTSVNAGHLMPIGRTVAWLTARISLYDWPLAASTTLVLLAGAELAMWKMLRTLFGNRPLILIPLGVFLFSPLSLASADGWAVSLEVLPLELAMFMAVEAHARYLRTRRIRVALQAAAWQAVAMASMEKGAVVPVLLFALTSAYLVPQSHTRWPVAMYRVLREHWKVWALYGALLAGYAVLLTIALTNATTPPTAPDSAGRVIDLAVTMIGGTLLTGVLGGPWQWWPAGLGVAQASPPAVLAQLSWALALLAIIISCLVRYRAWRAWVIVFAWIFVADVLPVAIGRLDQYPAGLLAVQTRYVTDGTGVLALCVAIAFLPLAGESDAYRMRAPALRVPLRIAAVLLAAGFLTGSAWSSVSLEASLIAPSAAARSYIATAEAAVTQAPGTALIVDSPAPAYVLDPSLFWNTGHTSQVVGAIAREQGKAGLRWSEAPRGAYDGQLMIFNSSGQLLPAVFEGPAAVARHGCLPEIVPVTGKLYAWTWELRFSYNGPAATIHARFGTGPWSAVSVPAGRNVVYLPVTGAGDTIAIVATPSAGCVTGLRVGSLQPGPAAQARPLAVLPG